MSSLLWYPESRPVALVGLVVLLPVLFVLGKVIYQLYVHPLSKIPGPRINAISRIPYIRHLLAGTTVDNVNALHAKYGDVVRVSPNEVSFTSIDTAHQDIYGFRTGKSKGRASQKQKDAAWYAPSANGAPSLLIADDEAHARHRRILSHAFSEKALAGQEVLLQKYVDQLIDRLRETSAGSGKTQDMVLWYNWTTFDVIADLTFGEPFGCLQNLATDKHVQNISNALAGFRLYYIMHYFPWVKKLGNLIVDQAKIAARVDFNKWVISQTNKRAERETQRPDFMTHILAANRGDKDGSKISMKEVESDNSVFLVAGSETTATMLASTTYFLLKNPAIMQKLTKEVRSRWEKYSDITLEEVNKAPYLLAVLSEGLRYFPPVPTGFERRVGEGGEMVSGHFIPQGTSVAVSHYTAYHDPKHFTDPDAFVPERWMGDEKYASDKLGWVQPFSYGPRNCLGKNLAYAEMRLIMAKMIWSYDLTLDPRSTNWAKECKVMALWAKPELLVHVKEVVGS
ncbi:hypothetical protein LTR86_007460 [Recurvomyces mirabilis]|nr:hypothetical protein LTR86_007460 [Recurvomyces mirabilis]